MTENISSVGPENHHVSRTLSDRNIGTGSVESVLDNVIARNQSLGNFRELLRNLRAPKVHRIE